MLHTIHLTKRGRDATRNVHAAHGLITDSLGREHHQWVQLWPDRIIVRSQRTPTVIEGYMREVSTHKESLPVEGQQIAFSFIGHPVKRQSADLAHNASGRNREIPLRGDDARAWAHRLLRPALEVHDLEHEELRPRRGTRWSKPLTLSAAAFYGTATITDGEAMSQLLSQGVGRAKRFGFGLLLVGPTGGGE